jgi:hypothetical protein
LPQPSGNDLPHPECVEACRAALHQAADRHYANYQRLDRRKQTRGNARVNQRMAVAYGWAAGQLRRLLEETR